MTGTTLPLTPYLRHAEQAVLEDWGALEEATGAAMTTSGAKLWSEGEQEIGIWQCTPGPSRWLLETHEFVHIVGGSMTVTVDGGEAVVLGQGDTAVFPKGWSGTWDIAETIRKLYVIF